MLLRTLKFVLVLGIGIVIGGCGKPISGSAIKKPLIEGSWILTTAGKSPVAEENALVMTFEKDMVTGISLKTKGLMEDMPRKYTWTETEIVFATPELKVEVLELSDTTLRLKDSPDVVVWKKLSRTRLEVLRTTYGF